MRKSLEYRSPSFLIAASGTGGHLLPALHIARALRERDPECTIEFVGSNRPLEAQIIDPHGFRRHVITIGGLKRLGLKGLIRWIRQLPGALNQVRGIFRDARPDVVIGVGGYVSFLPVVWAKCAGIPTWIHEAERHPGWANYVLSFLADRTSMAFEDTKLPCVARRIHTGAPMKRELFEIDWKREGLSVPPRLFIAGGSQGSHALDMGIIDSLDVCKRQGAEILHQSRQENVALLQERYRAEGISARVQSFIEKMEDAYQWCDLVVTRSGAGMVRELDLIGRPAVLVPLPGAGEQRYNASILERKGQALVVEEGEGFGVRLRDALEKILTPGYYQTLDRSGSRYERRDAAGAIAEGCLSLVKRNAKE